MSIKYPSKRRFKSRLYCTSVLASLLLASYPASEICAQSNTALAADAQRAADKILSESDNQTSVLTADNAIEVLYVVLDVITGKIYNDQYFNLHELTDTLVPTSTDYVLQTDRDSFELKTYACPEGGAADIAQRAEEYGQFESSDYTFVECSWNYFLINGTSNEFTTDFGEFHNYYDGLTLVNFEGQQNTLTGRFSRTVISDYGTSSPVGLHVFRSEEVALAIEDSIDILILNVTKTSLGSGVYCPRYNACYESASFYASFTLRTAQLTDDNELDISTPQIFVNDNGLELRFDRGTLSVIADDGSSLTVEADNGNPLSVTVTTVTADNISSSIDLSWSDLREHLESLR